MLNTTTRFANTFGVFDSATNSFRSAAHRGISSTTAFPKPMLLNELLVFVLTLQELLQFLYLRQASAWLIFLLSLKVDPIH